jgi:YD repeat-containing protein
VKLNPGEKMNYFRVYPENAEAKTFVYDVNGNMVQTIAEDNTSTYYEYDPFGKLVQSRNDDGVSFKSHHREYMNNEEN